MSGRDEAGPAASRRRPPWGLLGMLGLVVAIEWTLAGHDLDFTAPWSWDWRVIGRFATRPDRVANRDVLLFGDSLMKFGVMPRVIRERSGKSAYNFALHTGQISSSYYMFRRTLRAGARPEAVVLDLTPHLLIQSHQANAHLWGELLSPAEALDMAWATNDPAFFGSTVMASVLTSYKERDEIRAGILATIRGGAVASRRHQIPMFRRNWKANDGAQLMGDSPPPALDVDFWERSLFSHWAPQPSHEAYLDRFLTLARDSKIPVYWLLPPILPALLARSEASGFDAEYSRFVDRFAARFPGVVVVDARRSGFPPDLFCDGLHLNRRGALKLSAALAEVLRDRPAGRVALDLGRARPVDLPMEDVIQSAEIVQAAEAATARR